MTPRIGFLVGPGVLGHLDELHAAAERIGVAVVNTWGAKGVFRWDSPYHAGTAGLQERDFELAGLGEVDILVTSGLDRHEVTTQPWAGRASVIDVAPGDLGGLVDTWEHPQQEPVRPALYTALSAVVMPMYDVPTSVPAAVRALSTGQPEGGLVLGTPGLAGYWVARTWPTTVPGSVVVPGSSDVRVVTALAQRAVAAGRPTTIVTDSPLEVNGAEVIVWDRDLSIPEELIDIAGPLVAWK